MPPFQNERMKCVICKRTKRANPHIESNWTHIQVPKDEAVPESIDLQGYACPRCLQGYAHKHGWKKAYYRVLRAIVKSQK